jgi:hypothetical protein
MPNSNKELAQRCLRSAESAMSRDGSNKEALLAIGYGILALIEAIEKLKSPPADFGPR